MEKEGRHPPICKLQLQTNHGTATAMMSTDDLQSEGEQNGEVHDIRLRYTIVYRSDVTPSKLSLKNRNV